MWCCGPTTSSGVATAHRINYALNRSVRLFKGSRNPRTGHVLCAGITYDEVRDHAVAGSAIHDDLGDLHRFYWKVCKTVHYFRRQRGFSASIAPDPEGRKIDKYSSAMLWRAAGQKTHRARSSPLPQDTDTLRMMVLLEFSGTLAPRRKLDIGIGTGNGRKC